MGYEVLKPMFKVKSPTDFRANEIAGRLTKLPLVDLNDKLYKTISRIYGGMDSSEVCDVQLPWDIFCVQFEDTLFCVEKSPTPDDDEPFLYAFANVGGLASYHLTKVGRDGVISHCVTDGVWVRHKSDDETVDNMLKWFVNIYYATKALFRYVEESSLHIVEKHPPKRKKSSLKNKKPWVSPTGPSILFLNEFPRTTSEYKGGTHASPKGHQRRGHWRRLMNEVYHDHPKFQQKIWIKPAWIGPTEAVIDGQIFKVKF